MQLSNIYHAFDVLNIKKNEVATPIDIILVFN